MKTKVYYDGACHLCSREMKHYKKVDKNNKLQFFDISRKDFDAKKEGLDPKRVYERMHVRDERGEVKEGIDAFASIWRALGGYKLMIFFVETQPFRFFAKIGYALFARIRIYLPKRKECEL